MAESASLPTSEYDALIDQSVQFFVEQGGQSYDSIKVAQIPTYKADISKWDAPAKIAFIQDCITMVYKTTIALPDTYHGDIYLRIKMREAYVGHLLKSKISLEVDAIASLYQAFLSSPRREGGGITDWPILPFLKLIKKQYQDQNIPSELLNTLGSLQQELENHPGNRYAPDKNKQLAIIKELVYQAKQGADSLQPVFFMGPDRFATHANAQLEQMSEEEKQHWFPLMAQAQKARSGKPSKKFLDESQSLIQGLGEEAFVQVLKNWFAFIANLKIDGVELVDQPQEFTILTSDNTEAIKGFIWMAGLLEGPGMVPLLGQFAEKAYQKVSGQVPGASLGNACFYALYHAKTMAGLGQLSRLSLRIKQNSALKLIDKYLTAAAEAQGLHRDKIEDMAVEGFGLVSGKLHRDFEGYRAGIIIQGVGKTRLEWFKPDGKAQKSVPALVKEHYAEELKAFKNTKKQIEQMLSAQRDRIDRMFRRDRRWTFADFNRYYLEHGLMSYLTQGMIWIFKTKDQQISAFWLEGQWVNAQGAALEIPEEPEVLLWHPVGKTLAEVQEWRQFLLDREIKQPLKQAFREVYLLTPAEINTRIYSNRMAAHILKQHQFNSLAKIRGWKYSLMGAYDDGRDIETAQLELPEYNLRAEYWVQELNADDAFNETGIWLYVATDQVRFVDLNSEEVLPLEQVPARPFSEVMRDVDLFVGVASVGNDPNWGDSGGLPAYRDYWNLYSFGELGEIAKNRREILSKLLPRLKIRKVAEIQDRFLVVQGKLRTYKIHLGSGNILMEPNDEYLCIVPDRNPGKKTESLFLPFEGDRGLSIVLSKAFLLAEDDKIKDETIVSQIERGMG